MTLPVRIIVRTATPWEKMTRDDFYNQNHFLLPAMAVKETKQQKHVHVWEEAYRRSYCMYRAMVRDACMIQHKKVKPDFISVGIENVEWTESDEILLPIDDDDCYEPGIVETLKSVFRTDINVIVWPRRTNFLGRDRIENCSRYLDTCNFAIRKSFLAQWTIRDAMILLAFHWIASRMVHNRFYPRQYPTSIMGILDMQKKPPMLMPLRHESVLELDRPWSTYYLHSGSISFLAGGKMEKHKSTVEYLRGLPLHPLLET